MLNLINTQGNVIREQWDKILLLLSWENLKSLIIASIGKDEDW